MKGMSAVGLFVRSMTLVLAITMGLVGCKSSVTDTETQQIPNLMKKQDLASNMTIFEFLSDAMQRNGKFPINLVVDKSYYQQNEIKRGDIVYIELPEAMVRKNHEQYGKKSPDEAIETKIVEIERKQVFRVVGLPNETVSIKQGQVSINDKILDTFYGKEYYGEKVQDKSKAETMKEDVRLAQNQYFVLGDQWWRSGYSSNLIGAIPKEYIKGKIVGYFEEEKLYPTAK
jgi:signal peptidase I